MTLDEVLNLLEKSKATLEPRRDGELVGAYARRLWAALPRIPYADLPPYLQRKADEVAAGLLSANKVKLFLPTFYPNDNYSSIEQDEAAIAERLQQAFHAARWTIEPVAPDEAGEDQPPVTVSMYPEALTEAWEAVTKKKGRTRHARPADVLPVGNGRQLSITNKKYQFALTAKSNPSAYIAIFDDAFFDTLEFNEDGTLILRPGLEGKIKKAAQDGLQDVQNFNGALLRQIFTAAFKAQREMTADTIKVYFPDFCKEMGIDIQSGKPNDLFAKLRLFENYMGVFNRSKYYKVLIILGYDADENTLTLATPYMNRLLMEIASNPARKVDTRAVHYEIPGYCWLIHSSIVSERNEPAKDIVDRLLTGLVQRGGTPDNKLRQNANRADASDRVTYTRTFASIIDDVPLLKKRIGTGKPADRNKALKRAFECAYKLLRTRTDAYQYFIDLQVPTTIPTMTTLNMNMIITHAGISATYKHTGA